jgi:ubiquinol-cytochrome c reductase iron-sulfur subunit
MTDLQKRDATHEADGGSSIAVPGPPAPIEQTRFTDPGLVEHHRRLSDVDARAAGNAERQVVLLFVLSAAATAAALVAYFVLRPVDTLGSIRASTLALGLAMGLGLFLLGAGIVHWGKTLMPDQDVTEDRHAIRGDDATRADAVDILTTGVEESGITRRPMLRRSLLGALALFPLPGLVLLRDLGPMPGDDLAHTLWGRAEGGDHPYLVQDPGGERIRAAEVTRGSVFHVVPDNLEGTEHPLEEKAKAAVLLVRIDLQDVKVPEGREDWHVDGIFAYSKICTHLGCPVALYEQQTHHLLCPCHQSTFDLGDAAAVVFGPASRPLPQLPITVDDEGYLVARGDFPEPTGPSYWERG